MTTLPARPGSLIGDINSVLENIINGGKTIARSAFSGCAITSVTLPDTVVKIEAYAFSHCSMLSEVVIPDNVEIIEQGAFVESGLVDVVVPEKVRNLHGVFCRCHKITSATVKESWTILEVIAHSHLWTVHR